jgi:IS4 transposase
VLLRETYADAHQEGWALLTTEDFVDPQAPPRDYHRRTTIEELHRQLKCFHDLTDFHSRWFNAIAAQVVFVLLSYTLRQWQLRKFSSLCSWSACPSIQPASPSPTLVHLTQHRPARQLARRNRSPSPHCLNHR